MSEKEPGWEFAVTRTLRLEQRPQLYAVGTVRSGTIHIGDVFQIVGDRAEVGSGRVVGIEFVDYEPAKEGSVALAVDDLDPSPGEVLIALPRTDDE